MLETMDLDKDGKLSREEWSSAFGKIYEMIKSQENADKPGAFKDAGDKKDIV